MQLSFESITEDPVYLFEKNDIHVSVLRLDKIHPVISGNKWFKLRYYLNEAKDLGKKRVITFGGAWSNHIVATAAACQAEGLFSEGIIRGEEPPSRSPALQQAEEYGMRLRFISRRDYGEKKIPPALENEDYYLINEGGYGKQGVAGAAGILQFSGGNFTHCCCAIGTGTMMAGLIKTSPGKQVIGISVLKSNYQLNSDVQALLDTPFNNWQIIHDYHFGGYAKFTQELIGFMNRFYEQTGIPSDFVYTGKLFYAIDDLSKRGFFPAKSKILLIHSGGLQGNRSLGKGKLIY